jgi:hypothetical protein
MICIALPLTKYTPCTLASAIDGSLIDIDIRDEDTSTSDVFIEFGVASIGISVVDTPLYVSSAQFRFRPRK